MAIQHRLLRGGGWAFADRGLTQAAQTGRDHAAALVLVLPPRRGLVAVLAALGRGPASGGRIASRRKTPSRSQLLTDPALGGFA